MRAEAEWRVVERIFADEPTAFRHRMGLFKISLRDFYAPTSEAVSIGREKEAILASPEGGQYLVETGDGYRIWAEYMQAVGWKPRLVGTQDRAALHRAATVSLEPDWLLLTVPDWRLVWASVCFPTRWPGRRVSRSEPSTRWCRT